jgi:hypothetical protein
MPPIGVLWPVLVKLAPKLWELLVEGKDPDTISLGELIDETTKNRLRRDAALARAKAERAKPRP